MGKYSHTKAMALAERDIANARLEPLIKETVELRSRLAKATEERDEAQRKLHEAHRLLELAKHELQAQIGKLTEEAAARLRMLQEVSGLLEQTRVELQQSNERLAKFEVLASNPPNAESPVGCHDPCADGKITIEITKLPLETDHE